MTPAFILAMVIVVAQVLSGFASSLHQIYSINADSVIGYDLCSASNSHANNQTTKDSEAADDSGSNEIPNGQGVTPHCAACYLVGTAAVAFLINFIQVHPAESRLLRAPQQHFLASSAVPPPSRAPPRQET